jgi:hypothetical protein
MAIERKRVKNETLGTGQVLMTRSGKYQYVTENSGISGKLGAVFSDGFDRAGGHRFLALKYLFVVFGLLEHNVVVAGIGFAEVFRRSLVANAAKNALLVDVPGSLDIIVVAFGFIGHDF